MSTPGFKFVNRDVKADGTRERIELSDNNYALKKYTCPDGSTYSSVQSPRIQHNVYSPEAKSVDPMIGFRSTFNDKCY